jgi:hypothetical protein
MDAVINPFSGNALTDNQSEFIHELRTVRRGARNARRSGHPGKRAEANRILNAVPGMIATVYRKDASGA